LDLVLTPTADGVGPPPIGIPRYVGLAENHQIRPQAPRLLDGSTSLVHRGLLIHVDGANLGYGRHNLLQHRLHAWRSPPNCIKFSPWGPIQVSRWAQEEGGNSVDGLRAPHIQGEGSRRKPHRLNQDPLYTWLDSLGFRGLGEGSPDGRRTNMFLGWPNTVL